jgi:hypothetical protein
MDATSDADRGERRAGWRRQMDITMQVSIKTNNMDFISLGHIVFDQQLLYIIYVIQILIKYGGSKDFLI